MFILKEQRVYFEESNWVSLKDFYDRLHWSVDSKTWNILHMLHRPGARNRKAMCVYAITGDSKVPFGCVLCRRCWTKIKTETSVQLISPVLSLKGELQMNYHSLKKASPQPMLSNLHLILVSFPNTYLEVSFSSLENTLCCMDHCPWPERTTQPLVWQQGIAKMHDLYEKSPKVKTRQPPSKQVTKLVCSMFWSQTSHSLLLLPTPFLGWSL